MVGHGGSGECCGKIGYGFRSHSIDMCNYFNDEENPDWVMGQLDYREENLVFGAHNANQVLTAWEYENGVRGIGTSGLDGLIGAHNRLIGSEGVIEVGPDDADVALRSRRDGENWEAIDTDGEGLHSWTFLHRAVEDTVRAIDEGYEPELCARNALNATEIIFATYESVRNRGRVDCPLDIDDNPLVDLVDRSELTPESAVKEEDTE